jgi:hypothetical protein
MVKQHFIEIRLVGLLVAISPPLFFFVIHFIVKSCAQSISGPQNAQVSLVITFKSCIPL